MTCCGCELVPSCWSMPLHPLSRVLLDITIAYMSGWESQLLLQSSPACSSQLTKASRPVSRQSNLAVLPKRAQDLAPCTQHLENHLEDHDFGCISNQDSCSNLQTLHMEAFSMWSILSTACCMICLLHCCSTSSTARQVTQLTQQVPCCRL